jgi:type II secretory pathway pseudopilin PulG
MTNLHGVTWAVLLDGLLGGVIGTLGAFGAAAFAIWYDRRQQQRRERQRAADEATLRKRRAVGSLTGLLRTLETEARWAPFLSGPHDTGALNGRNRLRSGSRR